MQEERNINIEIASDHQSLDANPIQHIVSRLDTLAGLAIKYGVEVADIKRLNGLLTDHQMFALRSVQIPMPGRHPPSPVAGDSPGRSRIYDDALGPFSSLKPRPSQPKLPQALSSLQGYYGFTNLKMASFLQDIEPNSLISGTHLNRHRRAKSLANFNNDISDDDVAIDTSGIQEAKKSSNRKSVRRRQKTDTDSVFTISESENAESLPTKATGKGLGTDKETRPINAAPLGDSARVNMLASVFRKSSSTSNLQEAVGNPSVWQSAMWSLKPDGLPKSANSWRNKAALD